MRGSTREQAMKRSTADEVRDQLNAIYSLEEDVRRTEAAAREASKTHQEAVRMLEKAREEFGRMIDSTDVLERGEYRVVKRDRAGPGTRKEVWSEVSG